MEWALASGSFPQPVYLPVGADWEFGGAGAHKASLSCRSPHPILWVWVWPCFASDVMRVRAECGSWFIETMNWLSPPWQLW